MKAIFNTTVLSNFAAIDQLDVLRALFQHIYIPTAVYAEIQNGLEEGYTFFEGIESHISPFVTDGWIQLTTVAEKEELRLLGTLPRRIHQGEAACLAIAHQRQWLFLTDDLAARKIAQAWHIPLSGTLGCLTLAVKQQLFTLPQANRFLTEMIAYGYHSPVTDLSLLK